MSDRTVTDEFYAAVICRECGQVPLSEAEYVQQLSVPDRLWGCPKCGEAAEFDDTYFEDRHGINDEVEDDEPAF